MKKVISLTISVILLISAFAHIFYPEFYAALIPEFIPKTFANIAAALAEGIIGIMLLIKQYRHLGGLGFALLMLAFLPIHVWDLVREHSALGDSPVPEIRLIFQFILIYLGWWVYKTCKV